MPVEFKLPALGENVKSADVTNVLVKPGDVIAKDQAVLEAETDKAVVEIPSEVAGTVVEVKVKKGDTVKVGQVVLTVDGDGKAAAGGAPAAKKEAAVKPSSAIAAGEKPPLAGKPPEAPTQEPAPAAKPAPAPQVTPVAGGEARPVAAAPTVRQFAREIGVDIHQVPGTGEGGRITVDDVKNFARSRATSGGAAAGGAAGGPRSTIEPMSKLRKVAAAHLSRCWQEIPHVTLHDKADVTELETFRAQFKAKAEKAGGKLTITPIFVKIVVAALKAHPMVNASISMEKQQVEYKKYYNIGVAVDTPRGLVVPVIRDADKKSIVQMAVELNQIGQKAREGKLTPDDMSGATFTITNLGSIGVGFFTPIVNAPEVAILGMGRAVMEPVWDGSAFKPRLMAPLSLSFDHRLVDGADGARFLRYIVDAVTNPLVLALD